MELMNEIVSSGNGLILLLYLDGSESARVGTVKWAECGRELEPFGDF